MKLLAKALALALFFVVFCPLVIVGAFAAYLWLGVYVGWCFAERPLHEGIGKLAKQAVGK